MHWTSFSVMYCLSPNKMRDRKSRQHRTVAKFNSYFTRHRKKKPEICRWFNPTLATTGMLQIVFLEKTFSPPRERAV